MAHRMDNAGRPRSRELDASGPSVRRPLEPHMGPTAEGYMGHGCPPSSSSSGLDDKGPGPLSPDERKKQDSQADQQDYDSCETCQKCQTTVPSSMTFRVFLDTRHDLLTTSQFHAQNVTRHDLLAATSQFHVQNVTRHDLLAATSQLHAQNVTSAREALSREVRKLVKVVNALLNDCGGSVCVHCSVACPLYLLDSLIDPRLSSLICNATFYEDNFERLVVDERHVLYRVKPQRQRCISILDFHSCLSGNQGLGPPTQQQIQSLIRQYSQRSAGSVPNEVDSNTEQPVFEHLQPVSLFPSCKVHFHGIGKPGVEREARGEDDDYGKIVANFWWNDLKLGRYVAALCKQRTGGSVYLGIEERLTAPTRAWAEVPNCDLGQVFPGCRSKVWVDAGEPSRDPVVHYLAEEENVLLTPGRGTGQYVCCGVDLHSHKREVLQAVLERKIREEMLWYPDYPTTDPVSFVFHPVVGQRAGDQREDRCVVEMRVVRFHGVAFHDPRGLEAYGIKAAGPSFQVRRLELTEVMTCVQKFAPRVSTSLAAVPGATLV